MGRAAKIRILSDPYEKKIKFFKETDRGESEEISSENDKYKNADLVNADLVNNFFPFRMNKILDAILKSFYDGAHKTEIVFEGTEDEFNDLKTLCSTPDYENRIQLERSKKQLPNAREILPQIKEKFAKLRPIIDEILPRTDDMESKREIEEQLRSFDEAASDLIPICVVGNYSCGKSTFINALIGNEILPSGADPVTAKVFKIKQSPEKEKAAVSFFFREQFVSLEFSANGIHVSEGEIPQALASCVANSDGQSVTKVVRDFLTELTELSKQKPDPIGEIIEVRVSFNSYFAKHSKNPFMILDTPGSNSASNMDHRRVLENAMRGLSNGIPVFVTENKLDTFDNEDLINSILENKNLDNRFAMIVVNKADEADLTDLKEDRVLSQLVPKKLYSCGIYYVSAFMGLGSKTGGVFLDKHAQEKFKDNLSKFSDPDDEFYKKLYTCDIMPGMRKESMVVACEESQNLLLANSGLLAVERDIVEFADKYAAYNKCAQMERLLESILGLMDASIDSLHQKVAEDKEQKVIGLNNEKRELVKELGRKKKGIIEEAGTVQSSLLKKPQEIALMYLTSEEILKMHLELLQKEYEAEIHYEDAKAAKEAAPKAVQQGLVAGAKDVVRRKLDRAAIREMAIKVAEDIRGAREDSKAYKQKKEEIAAGSANRLLQNLIHVFFTNAQAIRDSWFDASTTYLEEKANEVRCILEDLVSEHKGIGADKRAQLTALIVEFPDCIYPQAQIGDMMTVEKLRKKIVLDHLVRLKFKKTAEVYNDEFMQYISAIRDVILTNHMNSFKLWVKSLTELLEGNIEEYNQTFHEKRKGIREKEDEIKTLEKQKKTLNSGKEEIKAVIHGK